MSRTPVKAIYTIVLEGQPGVGKSTIIPHIAKLIEKNVPGGDIVLLNGLPLDQPPAPTTNATRSMNYIQRLYDPELKADQVLNVMTIGFTILDQELDFFNRYLIDDKDDKLPTLYNVVERNTTVSGGCIFVPANFYNLRECSNIKDRVKDYYDKDWEKFKVVQDRLIKLGKRATRLSTFNMVIVLQGSADYCFEKMRRRGREYECTNMTFDYMQELTRIHRAYGEYEEARHPRVVPAREVYPMEKTVIKNVDTDEVYELVESGIVSKDKAVGALAESVVDDILLTLEVPCN